MRNLSRRGVERPGRSPEARGAAAAVCRAATLRYAIRLERGEGGGVDEGCRHQSGRRRHHRDFRIRRLTASAVSITPLEGVGAPEGGRSTLARCAGTISSALSCYGCVPPEDDPANTFRPSLNLTVTAFT